MKTNRFFLVLIILAGAPFPAAAQEITAQPGAQPVSIRIDAGKRSAFKISRTIFGSFLEPIGNSTYNGLWAEILQNPSFESGLWSGGNTARMLRERPVLGDASRLGLPLPWEPLDYKQGNRYEPRRGDAANSWQSLAIFGLPGHETGVRQQVFLPVARELHYKCSLYVKHLSGSQVIDVSLRKRDDPQQILGSFSLNAPAREWRRFAFALDLKPGQLESLEPADFVIQVVGDERVLIDQVSLMPADAIDGLDPEMIAMAKDMKTPLVRFGGNFTSAYHWRDGIGPRDKRVSMLNVAWGIPEYNQFGTDEFLRFCQRIGAEPQIALNLGSGTPQEAADWVRYVDQHWPEHHGLLWEMGNELWGDWNLGYPTLEELPKRTQAFSQAIREADPDARLIATGQDPDVYREWNTAQLSSPPKTFSFLSTHFVVTTDRVEDKSATPEDIAAATFALPVELGRRLHAMQSQIDESANFRDKVHIAFTEWLFVCCHEAGPANAPRWSNMGGAVAAGGFFNMLIQNAGIVPISDMTGIIEFAGIWKKRGRVYATPAYYTFRMYSSADPEVAVAVDSNSGHYDVHHGITRLPEISNVPYLDTVAVLNKAADRLTLFCVNRHLTQDLPGQISIAGFSPQAQARVESLGAQDIYQENDEVQPDKIEPAKSTIRLENSQFTFTFPHESITKIELIAQ